MKHEHTHLESWGTRVVFLARLWTPGGGLQAGLLRLRQLGDAVASESLGSNPVSVVLWLLELWQVSLLEAQFLLENGVNNGDGCKNEI